MINWRNIDQFKRVNKNLGERLIIIHFVHSQLFGIHGPGVKVYWQEAERALAFLIAASWKFLGCYW